MSVVGEIPAVAFRDVAKSYGGFVAVDGVSLSVARGELVTLLGPSGSGKSTLLSIAAGAVMPDRGGLFFGAADVTRLPPHRRNIGMVFQRYTLFPNKTVAENVAYPLEVRRIGGAEARRRVHDVLAMVGLVEQAGRYPSEISGGQAQRTAVARALVFDPALVLMDEPLGALDKALREDLQEEIRRIQQETRVPMLYVTHDQEEAMNLSDRIIMLNKGRIVAEGPPRQLYADPPSLWSACFLGEANVLPLHRPPGPGPVTRVEAAGLAFQARLKPGVGTGALAAIVRPEDVRIDSQPLAAGLTSPAVLEQATYLGARQRLQLRLPDGTQIKASVQGRRDFGPPGTALHLGWEAEHAYVVPAA